MISEKCWAAALCAGKSVGLQHCVLEKVLGCCIVAVCLGSDLGVGQRHVRDGGLLVFARLVGTRWDEHGGMRMSVLAHGELSFFTRDRRDARFLKLAGSPTFKSTALGS